MLHKHYSPNQQTPFLGRKIRYVVAILEEGSQGARSPSVSKLALLWSGVGFFSLSDYWSGVFLGWCFWMLQGFFVLFSTEAASVLAPKSCWALLDFYKRETCKLQSSLHCSDVPSQELPPSLPAGCSQPGQEGGSMLWGMESFWKSCLKWALLEDVSTKLPLKTKQKTKQMLSKNKEWC